MRRVRPSIIGGVREGGLGERYSRTKKEVAGRDKKGKDEEEMEAEVRGSERRGGEDGSWR